MQPRVGSPTLLTHPLYRIYCLFACIVLFSSTACAQGTAYEVKYMAELHPSEQAAKVTIVIADARLLRELDFNLTPGVHSKVEANGELTLSDGRALWLPPARNAQLTLWTRIPHQRDDGEFDAYMGPDWAIFRGDDLIPAASVRTKPGAFANATLEFKLPSHWTSVETGWEKIDSRTFRIDNPERRFDRPTGWMIAGKLGIRRDDLGETEVVVAAPQGSDLHRMDVLTFMNFVWPELATAFEQAPPKLLIVGAGNPMWRGGLSAPNSLFLHADRPLVSENGTSALVHEIVHMVTRIRGTRNHDWIAEGLTEFYAVELLYRAGGMTGERRAKVFNDLAQWGSEADTLIKRRSTGATTARAAVLFEALDREIRQTSDNRLSIDHLARVLISERKVALDDVQNAFTTLTGKRSKVLQSPLLSASPK